MTILVIKLSKIFEKSAYISILRTLKLLLITHTKVNLILIQIEIKLPENLVSDFGPQVITLNSTTSL